MAGNVRDWCLDPWAVRPRAWDGSVFRPPALTADAPLRCARGGSIYAAPVDGVASRIGLRPDTRTGDLGFRLVRPLSPLQETPC